MGAKVENTCPSACQNMQQTRSPGLVGSHTSAGAVSPPWSMHSPMGRSVWKTSPSGPLRKQHTVASGLVLPQPSTSGVGRPPLSMHSLTGIR